MVCLKSLITITSTPVEGREAVVIKKHTPKIYFDVCETNAWYIYTNEKTLLPRFFYYVLINHQKHLKEHYQGSVIPFVTRNGIENFVIEALKKLGH